MSLIKIFPAFSPETEKNIQADISGSWNNLNIWLQDTKSELVWYIQIPFIGDSLYERVHNVYKNHTETNIPEEREVAINRLSKAYSSAEDLKEKQFTFYKDLWAKMVNGDLAQNRNFLVSYAKFCIIFGPIITNEEFTNVLVALKDKQVAKNAAEKAERDEKDRIEEEKRREAEWARIDKVKQRIINDEPIDGEDLVSFCKDYGIDIHIRTQGTIKQKVSEINSGQYRVQRGTLFKIPPTHYYKLLQDMIKEEGKPEEPISPEMEKLFGK